MRIELTNKNLVRGILIEANKNHSEIDYTITILNEDGETFTEISNSCPEELFFSDMERLSNAKTYEDLDW